VTKTLEEAPPEAAPDEQGLFLNYEQAAALLGPWCTPRWIKQQVLDGLIASVPMRGIMVIERAEIERFIERQKAQAEEIRAKRSAHGKKARAARSRKARKARGS
jgi:hypothetical protein